MKRMWPMILMVSISGTADAATPARPGYLCVADASTGFRYENNRWNIENFNVSQKKYTLSVPEGKTDYEWKEFGVGGSRACEFFTNLIRCSPYPSIAIEVLMFPNILEYRMAFIGFPGKETTPFIEIGRCSPL